MSQILTMKNVFNENAKHTKTWLPCVTTIRTLLLYSTSATNQLTVERAFALYVIKKILTHLCVVKLFDETFFCFPLTGNNSKTLTFLFDCLDMKLNLPTCFKGFYFYIAGCLFQCLYIR